MKRHIPLLHRLRVAPARETGRRTTVRKDHAQSIRVHSAVMALCVVAFPALAVAQTATSGTNRMTVPFSDPSRPGTVKVHLVQGSILVTGTAGKEVLIDPEAHLDTDAEDARAPDAPRAHAGAAVPAPPTPPKAPRVEVDVHDEDEDVDERARGLRKIPNLSAGLSIEESDNVIEIGNDSWMRPIDLHVQVPAGTILDLQTVNAGDIVVRDVDGEMSVENVNGSVRLTNVSGAVVAHALNGELVASLKRIDPKKGCSFTSLNGEIDVTLPADVRADLRIKSDNGEIFTDFDVQLGRSTGAAAEDEPADSGSKSARKSGKKSPYNFETAMTGTVNGGGPTLRFQNFNGNIYIRKAK